MYTFLMGKSSDPHDVNSYDQLNPVHQSKPIFDHDDVSSSSSESDEENGYMRPATSFLRFGRQIPSSSGSFLRFGRSSPLFSRFNRGGHNTGTFLRFGRRGQQSYPSSLFRFSRKGDFLRFG
ncbi:unnamed protein product [Rotaria sp. Silwood1]|nr:unnamed protein product [Rotaria sp. Silwood1]CAF0832718.1 unnamed protein product [Rotaria sp. Silwood1]CAF0930589.1 unnamed protein product [Rotaria sp. Silwood1]CAF3338798.1 unnamed protein product [Rotaria sp. Silwood1]CAF3361961.1 unnamed protein product [Rotaria sp. Silwood1]